MHTNDVDFCCCLFQDEFDVGVTSERFGYVNANLSCGVNSVLQLMRGSSVLFDRVMNSSTSPVQIALAEVTMRECSSTEVVQWLKSASLTSSWVNIDNVARPMLRPYVEHVVCQTYHCELCGRTTVDTLKDELKDALVLGDGVLESTSLQSYVDYTFSRKPAELTCECPRESSHQTSKLELCVEHDVIVMCTNQQEKLTIEDEIRIPIRRESIVARPYSFPPC